MRRPLGWLCALSLVTTAAAQPVSKPQTAAKPPAVAKAPSTARPAARTQSVKALLALAHEQSEGKDLRGALETLRQARALAPNSEEVLAAYAEASLAVRAPLSAVPVLEALTRMCPSVGQYHYLLGTALVQAGDVAAAVVPLKEAERLEPNEPPILVALGTALTERKLYPEAKPPLLHALSLAPDNVEAMAALAEAEEGLGELQPAEDHAQRALARSAGDATANQVMGMVRMKQERYAEARDALSRAVALDPCSTKAQYQLSLAYARLGDPASAEKHLARYRRCAAEAESRLEQVRALTGFSTGGMSR
jgi:tetratricopeptide (TPR) repeat protein